MAAVHDYVFRLAGTGPYIAELKALSEAFGLRVATSIQYDFGFIVDMESPEQASTALLIVSAAIGATGKDYGGTVAALERIAKKTLEEIEHDRKANAAAYRIFDQ